MIPIKNVYYMLSYAFKCLNESGYKNVETEEFENVAELCAAILYRGISSQLKQGFGREYISQAETISTLKGKIDFSASIKQNTMFKKQMVCSYNEFSVNSYMNRILKTTMFYLLRSDISSKRKAELRKLVIFFSDVEELDINLINWKINFSRNNQTYRMLIAVCQLVLKGLLQTQSDGTQKLMDFVDEQRMHRLYERFILEFYRAERKDLTVNAIQIPWITDDDYQDMLPVMQTDITLSKGTKTLIIDTKYYTHATQCQFNSNKLHSGNLYQIFTYVKNLTEQMKNIERVVSGMLLYAKTDENVTPDNNQYSMSGNIIIVHSLDLNRGFNEIKQELNDIVERYFYTINTKDE